MAYVIETSIIALVPGTFEGILAVAIVVLFRQTGVVNVSLAASGAAGCLTVAWLWGPIGTAAALLVGLAVCVALSLAITAVVETVPHSAGTPLPSALTLVAALILEQVLSRLWSTGLEFPQLLPQRIISIGRYQLTPLHLVGVFAGVAAVLIAFAVLRLSRPVPKPGVPEVARWNRWRSSNGAGLLLAGILAFSAACLTAEATFGPGYMVAPAVVAFLGAAMALFRRPEIAFLAAVAIEVARNLSMRYGLPHAGYTSGVAIVAAVAAAAYAVWFLLRPRVRTA